MRMIVDDHPTERPLIAANDSLLEPVDHPASVRVIAHDLLRLSGPRHNLIDGSQKIDP
jgi:hypothetical protein